MGDPTVPSFAEVRTLSLLEGLADAQLQSLLDGW